MANQNLLLENPSEDYFLSVIAERATNTAICTVSFTREDADNLLQAYEIATNSSFVCRRTDKSFTKKGIDINRQASLTINWEHGIPFIKIGKKEFDCKHGHDYNVTAKEKLQEQKNQLPQDHAFAKQQNLYQNTKKMNCPAQLKIKEVLCNTTFKVNNNAPNIRRKQNAAAKVIDLAENKSKFLQTGVTKIYIYFPPLSAHKNHTVGIVAGITQNIDKRIITKIHELIDDDLLMTAKEVQKHIKTFVKNVLKYDGENLSRRLDPLKKDIANHIYLAKVKHRSSNVDQENVAAILRAWSDKSPGNNTFIRTQTVDSDKQILTPILIVLQTLEQKKLMSRYGQEIFLLDATYKTTKYTLPLFTICVQSNFGYLPVANFITHDETINSIKEGLQIVKDWNPEWSPTHSMCDFSEAEIKAVETVFPDCKVLLCGFHREQAWNRWVKKQEHGVSEYEQDVKHHLRNMAGATTEEEFDNRKEEFFQSRCFISCEKIQKWFVTKWLPEKERWVSLYRLRRLNTKLNTTNGLESLHNVLKNCYLRPNRSLLLGSMIRILLFKFIPDILKKYKDGNAMASSFYRLYDPRLPVWMRDRPKHFLDHCQKRYFNVYRAAITTLEPRIFSVPSETCDENYIVNFGNNKSSRMPSCTCYDWIMNHLPCKHMFAIFEQCDGFGWNALPDCYRMNPLFCLDNDFGEPSAIILPKITSTVTSNYDEPVEYCDSQRDNVSTEMKKLALNCRILLRKLENDVYSITDEKCLTTLEQLLMKATIFVTPTLPKENDLVIRQEVIKKSRKRPADNEEMDCEKINVSAPDNYNDGAFVNKGVKKDVFLGVLPRQKKRSKKDTNNSNYLSCDINGIILENNNDIETEELPQKCDTHHDQQSVANIFPMFLEDESKFTVDGKADVGEKYRIGPFDIMYSDLRFLDNNEWLDDKCINVYLHLIGREKNRAENGTVFVVDSFLTQKWGKMADIKKNWLLPKVQLKGFKWVFLPVCANSHWFLLAANFPKREFSLIDSLDSPMAQAGNKEQEYFTQWMAYLKKRKNIEEVGTWTIKTYVSSQQNDGSSCGIFVLMNAEALLAEKQLISMQQAHVYHFREYAKKKIIHHMKLYTKGCDSEPCTTPDEKAKWIQCDICLHWFHYKCVNITTKPKKYFCQLCLETLNKQK